MNMNQSQILFEFQYASFILEPYSRSEKSSSKLLKELILKLGDKDFPVEKRVKDRHENRKKTAKRLLVNISAPFESQGIRCFGKMALIKDKAPMIWGGTDLVEEIEKPQNKQFIEITHYVINFNENSDPVIMIEYNHSGPRLSDIEYYFRQISKDFKIAKSLKSSLHLDTKYDELDKELKNVFAITVKVDGVNSQRSNWLASLKNLKADTGYKDVRLEFSYQRRKDNANKFIKNIQGLDFARGILGWLKKDNNNIELVDDLKMSYQVTEGDEVIDLDFLKNKKTSFIMIPSHNGYRKYQEFKGIIGQEFNYYLSTGQTHDESPKNKK